MGWFCPVKPADGSVFCREGGWGGALISKLGILVRGGAAGVESGTPKDMISTMLDTSFLTTSGRAFGSALPWRFRPQRYIANANSGKSNWPDLVVSARCHI